MTTEKEFIPFEPAIRHKEIDLIQSVITRMADNQFKVKGFCITVCGFFLGFFGKNVMIFPALIASLITIWGCYKLDLKFLEVEKLYRMWFEFLMNKRSETKAWLFELSPVNIKKILEDQPIIQECYNVKLITKKTRKSWSFWFYIMLVGIITILFICLLVLPQIQSIVLYY